MTKYIKKILNKVRKKYTTNTVNNCDEILLNHGVVALKVKKKKKWLMFTFSILLIFLFIKLFLFVSILPHLFGFFLFCNFMFYMVYVEGKSLMLFFIINFCACVLHISMVLSEKSFFCLDHLFFENRISDNSKYEPIFVNFYFGIMHWLVSSVLLSCIIISFINQKILVQKGYLFCFFFYLLCIVGYLVYLALMLQFVFFEAIKKVAVLQNVLSILINKVGNPLNSLDKDFVGFNIILDLIKSSFLYNRFFFDSLFPGASSVFLDFYLASLCLFMYFSFYLVSYLSWCLIVIFLVFQIKLRLLALCDKFPKFYGIFVVCYFFFFSAGLYVIVLSTIFIKFFFEFIFRHTPNSLLLTKTESEQWSNSYEMVVSIIFFFFFFYALFFFF